MAEIVKTMHNFLSLFSLHNSTKQSTTSSTTTIQTLRILNDNYLHFITISFLLILIPFTIFASAAVQFYSSSGTDYTTQFDSFNVFLLKTIIANSQNLLTLKTLITVLTFILSVLLPTVSGIALITYSTNQAINNKPLSFSSSIKSLSCSFTPLLSTIIAGSIKLILVSLLLTLSPIFITESIKALGLGSHFIIFISIFLNSIVSYGLVLTIVFFIASWSSAAAISVLESKSGFEPLQQSANIPTEFRSHSFSIAHIVGYTVGAALLYSSVPPSYGQVWILQVYATYLHTSLMILYYVVENTVLYVQYKDARGRTTVEGEVSGVSANEKNTGGFSYMMHFATTVWAISLFLMLLKIFKFV